MRGINPTQVPTVPVEINWGHPLAQGLVGLYLPGVAFYNLANGNPLSVAATGSIGATKWGPGSSSQLQDSYVPPYQQTPTNCCIWIGNLYSVSANATLFQGIYANPNTTPYATYGMYADATSAVLYGQWNAVGNYNDVASSTTLSLGNQVVSVNWITEAIADFVNGVHNGGIVGGFSPTYSSTSLWLIGSAGSYTAGVLNYNTSLPASLQAWAAAEPFSMLKPIIRKKYYFPQTTTIINISSLGEIFGESGQSSSGFMFGNSVGENSSYPLTNLLGELALTSVGGQFAQEVSEGGLISQIYIQYTEENYSKTSNSVDNTISSTDISVGSGSAVASPYVPVLLISSESQSVSQGSANPYVNSYVFAISETSGFSGQSIVLSASIEALGETTSDIAVQAYVESHVINIGSEEIAVSYGGFDNIKRYSNAEYLLLPFKNFNQISIG